MCSDISQTDVTGIWQVVFTGRTDAKARREAVEEVIRLTGSQNFTGILVDLRDAEVVTNTLDEYQLGVLVSTTPEFSGIRIAYLENPGSFERSKFLETIEKNRGLKSSLFTDRDQAIKWLSEIG